ncbi:MAG TPA: phospholipid carrier-dependent glycosyltransferase [Steroidobacteraceae bacterium]|nr:phospholipid carrier-dependent glycosyltransferase [Steroidobacteraceae bacterium]
MAIEAGRGRTRGLGWLAWLVLAAAWFATLQSRPLFDPDEGRYAEIPREMVATGDWLTPRLDGLKYFEKPPLQYWATATAYSLFGLSEWTARLWTVGLAFVCFPMVFGWTRRLYGYRAGLAAVVALAVSPYFGVIGHLNLLDAGFSFWLTGAVFAFTLAQCSPAKSRDERRWMLLAWLAAALAILGKGIVVGVLAGASLFVYSVVERDIRPWKRLQPALGLPLFLLVCAPWFIAVSLRNPDFAGFFFIHEHFARFLTTVHKRSEPVYFFLPLLLFGVLPWGASIVGACRFAWRDAGQQVQPAEAQPVDERRIEGPRVDGLRADERPFKPLRFLLIFSVITLAFFSASGSKLAPYIQPMFPPLAAIVGAYAAGRSSFLRQVAIIVSVIAVIAAVGLLIYSALHNAYIPQAALIWAGTAVAVVLGVVVATWRRQASGAAGPAVAIAAAAAFAWQCFMSALAVTPPAHSARDLVAATRPYVHPQTELFSVGQYRETISPYLRRTLTLVGFEGELEFGLHAEPGRQAAAPEEFVSRWRASRDAVAFFGPKVWDEYRRKGLPGRVIAADNNTVAVTRS